jgi:hypothetical protein
MRPLSASLSGYDRFSGPRPYGEHTPFWPAGQRALILLLMRFVLAAFLVALGLAAGLFAYGALKNLWADDADSSTSTYLLIGLPLLAFSVAALVSAATALRRTD